MSDFDENIDYQTGYEEGLAGGYSESTEDHIRRTVLKSVKEYYRGMSAGAEERQRRVYEEKREQVRRAYDLERYAERSQHQRSLTTPAGYIIDCDAAPFVPDGWSLIEHRKGGKIQWKNNLIRLYFSKNQVNGNGATTNEVRREVANMPVVNANVLDYLLAHQELIPAEWKKRGEGDNVLSVYFWGTIYRYDGELCVRGVYWARPGGKRGPTNTFLATQLWFGEDYMSDPAAVLNR